MSYSISRSDEVPKINGIVNDDGSSQPFNPDVKEKGAWVIPAISLALSAASVVGNYLSNRNTNRTNEAINNRNNAFNAEQSQLAFNREAAYDDPSALVKRLQYAGLNPNLAAGDLPSMPSASPASASSPIAMQSPFNVDPMTFSNVALNMAQARNINAQTEQLPVHQAKIEAEIDRIKTENEHTAQIIENLKQNNLLTQQQVLLAGKESQKMQAEIDQINQKINESKAYENVLKKRLDVMQSEINEHGAHSRYYVALSINRENLNSLWEGSTVTGLDGMKFYRPGEKDMLLSQYNKDYQTNRNEGNYQYAIGEAFDDPSFYDIVVNKVKFGIEREALSDELNAYVLRILNNTKDGLGSLAGNSPFTAFTFMWAASNVLRLANGHVPDSGDLFNRPFNFHFGNDGSKTPKKLPNMKTPKSFKFL